ncbi:MULTISPECIES: response regulator [Marinomonas]|uniref:Response regulator n=1 Tax=Marinomonas arctica TaxID=383750 RepID=A0A7H1J9Z1_9GAMM|nr:MULTISPECIES: response regulator [Marinomonas]MCS7488545.1 transcriptional regulator [Marinomonas sp. BSi20414]QNT07307.1 response regulator [Marinomonas arctica]GGN27638.1 DNA-binding response regulator [Marinomonas arctica]
MPAQILVIDDENQIRKMLRIALKSVGYDVSEADSVASGLAATVRQQPDLVVLDLGLPDGDGLELLAELRSFSKVPVIVLSVRSGDPDKIKALDLGAQDYVTKPFSVEELLARIRAQLRDRLPDATPVLLDDGYLQIDLARRLVCCEGRIIEFTPKEYAVLAKLAQHRQCVITQRQLLEQIWGLSHVQDTHYLRIVVSHIRQKIGDDPTTPRYLITEAGIGYRLML